MSKIKNFPGGVSPVLSYGPNKYYGPTQYQVVEIHNNTPTSSACDTLSTGQSAGHLLGGEAKLGAIAHRVTR